MAKRICFISRTNDNRVYEEVEIEFSYYKGFSISQKQKSIRSMHENIAKYDKNLKILEVSTKSLNPLGILLSAFNLKFLDETTGIEFPVENIFQSSKVFEKGGPYRDLLNIKPKDAKMDERLKKSGKLINFNYNNTLWNLEPKTMFYDWIYISSIYRNMTLTKQILDYDAFTDIEFNHEKSVNCQARSAAIFVSLYKNGLIEDVLRDRNQFFRIYADHKNENFQISLFD